MEPTLSHERTSAAERIAPGPRGHLILGSLNERKRNPLAFFMNSALRYGDVVRFRMATRIVYLVSSPEHAQHVLMDNHRNYVKGFGYDKMERLLGKGLLTSEGDFWRRQRRLAQPAFHRQRLAALVETMSRCTDAMISDWEWRAARAAKDPMDPEARFDIAREMMKLTLQIASLTLLGKDVSGEATEIGQALTRLIGEANRAILSLWDFTNITGGSRQFRKDRETLNRVVYGIIEERRKIPEGKRPHDLLSMLMEAKDEDTGESMTDEQLRDEVMTFFLAGHETTANGLAWAWYLLSSHPEVSRRLVDETRSVLGDRAPTFEDLPKLTQSLSIFEETLRLYPPAWIVSRETVAEDRFGPYRIEPHSIVVVSPYVMHHHPRYWENPEGFDPQRFARDGAAARPRYVYMPFGGGPRQCIGSNFALMEAQVILSMIARRFQVSLFPGHPIELEPLITLRPRHGVQVIVRTRN